MPAERLSRRVMIVAGEASGDLHGAKLLHALKKLHPDMDCYGIGGERMRQAGFHSLVDVSELSVIGLTEAVKHYRRLRKILNRMKEELQLNRPEVLVLIDSPDFNLPLAKAARKLGIKVLYYISPQIWAWRSSRIRVIKHCVDMMATVFPFEESFYRDAGVPVAYVGHPLVEDAHATADRAALIRSMGLDAEKRIVGIFPGSRESEIEHNLPVLVQSALALSKRLGNLQFVVPVAPTLPVHMVERYIQHTPADITATNSDIYDVIDACDAVAATSGTVTLQVTLMQTPMVILYRVSPLTYLILKRLVNFSYAGIANVIADREICREFIQHEASPENIAGELERLLSDPAYTDRMKREMGEIRKILGERNGSVETARLALQLIESG
ncbi:MAG: lipid-A-disaccharide synthase [Gammaproteobacteria bacterium]|nr:lipid-A-disaccharide synthase [Gammaproteobacteria bacterium]